MSERKYSIDNDLKEAQRMIEALEPYVYQDQLYMPISGGGIFSPMPALTIGAVLLRLRRLDALRGPMTDNQQTTLDALLDQNRKVWNEWRVHYEKKLAEEANSRLKLLSGYLQDCKDDPRACASNYPAEALRRPKPAAARCEAAHRKEPAALPVKASKRTQPQRRMQPVPARPAARAAPRLQPQPRSPPDRWSPACGGARPLRVDVFQKPCRILSDSLMART